MQQETILTKNIRPASLAWTLVTITVFAFFDGWFESFNLSDEYIRLFGVILTTQVAFYYTSRGYEKTHKKKEDNDET